MRASVARSSLNRAHSLLSGVSGISRVPPRRLPTRYFTQPAAMSTENDDLKTVSPNEGSCQKVDGTAEKAEVSPKVDEKLPPLSPAEHKIYNELSVLMEYYHNMFRRTWTELYNACSANKRPRGMSLAQFIREGISFCDHVTLHHDIEEAHFFPRLAVKMECFRHNTAGGGLMVQHHKMIHKGLVKMSEYLNQCKSGERELRMEELKEVMDSFGTVLWTHLDAEVEQLKAENMRKFWSVAEMRTLRI